MVGLDLSFITLLMSTQVSVNIVDLGKQRVTDYHILSDMPQDLANKTMEDKADQLIAPYCPKSCRLHIKHYSKSQIQPDVRDNALITQSAH